MPCPRAPAERERPPRRIETPAAWTQGRVGVCSSLHLWPGGYFCSLLRHTLAKSASESCSGKLRGDPGCHMALRWRAQRRSVPRQHAHDSGRSIRLLGTLYPREPAGILSLCVPEQTAGTLQKVWPGIPPAVLPRSFGPRARGPSKPSCGRKAHSGVSQHRDMPQGPVLERKPPRGKEHPTLVLCFSPEAPT